MPKPEYYVFVCSQQRPPGHPRGSCANRGAGGLMQQLSQSVMSRQLFEKVSVVPTGCLGPCDSGANMLVFPGAVLYSGLEAGDIDTIVEQHFVNGEPITEKLAPEEAW